MYGIRRGWCLLISGNSMCTDRHSASILKKEIKNNCRMGDTTTGGGGGGGGREVTWGAGKGVDGLGKQ
jgi:hypothetical protein